MPAPPVCFARRLSGYRGWKSVGFARETAWRRSKSSAWENFCLSVRRGCGLHLAQDNHMIDALAPDRSDQPFGKPILPRRGWRGRLVPDPHGAKSACDNAAIDPIPIADEVVRSLIPGKGLRYLTCNPFCRRICCDVDPDELSTAEPDDDEGIKQVETDRWNHEQVHGGDVPRVVTQEGSPSLAGWPPSFDHVLGA